MRDKKQFRRQFQRLGLVPHRLRHRQHRRFLQASRAIAIGGSSIAWSVRPGFLGSTRHDVAHDRMQDVAKSLKCRRKKSNIWQPNESAFVPFRLISLCMKAKTSLEAHFARAKLIGAITVCSRMLASELT